VEVLDIREVGWLVLAAVDDEDLVAVDGELADEGAADEPRAADDRDSHHRPSPATTRIRGVVVHEGRSSCAERLRTTPRGSRACT